MKRGGERGGGIFRSIELERERGEIRNVKLERRREKETDRRTEREKETHRQKKEKEKKRQRLYRWNEPLSSTMSGSIPLVKEYVGTPCPSGQGCDPGIITHSS